MQFGPEIGSSATWRFDYPFDLPNRFERRLANASFIAEHVKAVEHSFTHVIFVHVSMQFGLVNLPLRKEIQIWTFPMFLTPSYIASGENVPESYLEMERLTLAHSKNILTPSYFEKRQLMEFYSIPEKYIYVVPRGVDTRLIVPKVRSLKGTPKFCNIGSIKPQKNTLGLIRLFANIRLRFPDATLSIIGPVQDSEYYTEVRTAIKQLGLCENIELTGYIFPNKLSQSIQEAHLHLSTSTCETFGRAIFETLASGLPNIARANGNAAAEFLENLPYAQFVDTDNEALNKIEEMLSNLPKLSSMALEIGRLYDDEMLSQLLAAKICNKDCIAISDFDGTLFHKNDPEKTKRYIKSFQNFPIRVLCSARPLHDLLHQLEFHQLKVDWIISYSGSMVADGCGNLLWLTPLDIEDVTQIEALVPQAARVEFESTVLQIAVPLELSSGTFGFRIEIYQETAFIAHWEASKLRAVHRLLRHINWSGCVHVFGDGLYDRELLTYFDGTLITDSPYDAHQEKENENA